MTCVFSNPVKYLVRDYSHTVACCSCWVVLRHRGGLNYTLTSSNIMQANLYPYPYFTSFWQFNLFSVYGYHTGIQAYMDVEK